jgi:hypothetical protein
MHTILPDLIEKVCDFVLMYRYFSKDTFGLQEIISSADKKGVTTTYTELNKLLEGHPTVQVPVVNHNQEKKYFRPGRKSVKIFSRTISEHSVPFLWVFF